MYRIFDILIESDVPIPELPEIDGGEALIFFHLSSDSLSNENQLEWYHHWRLPDGTTTISCARRGDDYYLRFPELADFMISSNGKQIHCFALPDVSDETIRHLLVDQVIPRVVAHRGYIVLHASAIELEGGMVAFLGESGWGKSTLATSFYEHGYHLLTDDCLLLKPEKNQITGIPGYAGSRLWSDSLDAIVNDKSSVHPVAHYSDKKRLIFSEGLKNRVCEIPIRAIFVLLPPDESKSLTSVVVEQLTGAKMIMELIKHSFHLDVTDKNKISLQFEILGQVTGAYVPIYRLNYRRDHALLNEVRDIVCEMAIKGSIEETRPS